jgi:hypothetical protein
LAFFLLCVRTVSAIENMSLMEISKGNGGRLSDLARA